MSRIVVISSVFLNIPSANGICARSLVRELRDLGHDVSVICYENDGASDEEFSENIFVVPQPKFSEKKTLVYKILRFVRVLLGNTDVLINSQLVCDYKQKLLEITQKGSVDAVIAMFFPFESVEAMFQYKKMYSDVKSIIYELDSVGDGVSNSNRFIIYKMGYVHWLKKMYKSVSNVFIMKSHENYWKKEFGNIYTNKLRIVDLPLLANKCKCNVECKDSIIMIYSGLIEKKYRSPIYLLSLLKCLNKFITFDFYFFSKGDCERWINDVSKGVQRIHQKGYVPPNVLEKEMMNADYLVSIGNSFSRSVPSKIITYVSYGKPIVHFSSQKDDVCCEYLREYPFALFIDQTLPLDVACEKFLDFIKSTKGKRLEYKRIKEIFRLNDPQHSAIVLSKCIKS